MAAEELLRTRTVPELREICQRLEVEAAQKQRELQTMVGSKYRDFIQSTDAIDFMNQRAVTATRSLDSFWTRGQELIENIHRLYSDASAAQAAEPAPETAAITSTMAIGISSVSSEVLWTCLGDCNVFDASMVRLHDHSFHLSVVLQLALHYWQGDARPAQAGCRTVLARFVPPFLPRSHRRGSRAAHFQWKEIASFASASGDQIRILAQPGTLLKLQYVMCLR